VPAVVEVEPELKQATQTVPEPEPEFDTEDDVELSESDAEFVHNMVLKIILFTENLCDMKFRPYQREVAYRVIESVILRDGKIITVLQARQSGKSAVLGSVITGMMVLLPRLAKAYPDLLGTFAKGFMVGVFAPTESQAETVWNRVYDNLTSKEAKKLFLHPEIDDRATRSGSKTRVVQLQNSGSLCRMQTANAKAKIESKTYHFVLVDEAQEVDSDKVKKSIGPMLSSTNGTRVYTGTPSRVKNVFYEQCRRNKLAWLNSRGRKGAKQNHFEYTYKTVIQYLPDYKKFIATEKLELGEDSDEFQMSYNCKWMLDQGMFITEERLNTLGDVSMNVVPSWWASPVVVGIDPARTHDSTVVTVVWVDWEHPDAYGYREHRILNWKEIHNKEWEEQYAIIANFLSNYNVMRIGVDAQGMGGPVAERLKLWFPDVDVQALGSDPKAQAERWKHLKTLMERERFIYPAHSKTRRLKSWQRFHQQMTDLQTKYSGKYMLAEAPDERNAFDDYGDSAALACYMTVADTMPAAEQFESPFVGVRGR
jgi:hypothetical protein